MSEWAASAVVWLRSVLKRADRSLVRLLFRLTPTPDTDTPERREHVRKNVERAFRRSTFMENFEAAQNSRNNPWTPPRYAPINNANNRSPKLPQYGRARTV